MPRKAKRAAPKRRKAHRRQRGGRMLQGEGFFDDVGNFFKSSARKVADVGRTIYDKALRPAGSMLVDRLKKPSTYLGLAGALPGPLAPVFKGASIITGLAGHGRHRVRAHRQAGCGSERMFGCALSN